MRYEKKRKKVIPANCEPVFPLEVFPLDGSPRLDVRLDTANSDQGSPAETINLVYY